MIKKNHYIKQCPTREELLKFLSGSLSREKKKAIEIHCTSCEFCRDAFEGYNNARYGSLEDSMEHLDNRFIHLQNKNRLKGDTSTTITTIIAVAASIAAVILIFRFLNNPLIKNYQSIADYNVELSRDFTPPSPPESNVIPPSKFRNSSQNMIEKTKDEKKQKSSTIKLDKKKPIENTKLRYNKKPDNIIVQQNNKKVATKQLAEANFIIPKEKIRYGYSLNDKIITIQFITKNSTDENANSKILPSFRNDGLDGFVNYINKNLQYPKVAYMKNIQGTVVIHFTVEKNGLLSNIHLVKKVHPSLDLEALRVIRSSPRWFPARIGNQPVKVQISCPVNFVIE